MRLQRYFSILRGLTVQVLLWTILPFTILLVIFSLTGISQHEAAMHALAAEENEGLALALARVLSLAVTNSGQSADAAFTRPDDIAFDDLLPDLPSVTIGLIDRNGMVIYGDGPLNRADDPLDWSQVQPGTSAVVFDDATDDVIAYAPVAGTGWTLALRKHWHSLEVPLIRFQEAMPFILFAAAAISLLTLYSGLRFVVRPLRLLGLQAGRIGVGDFHAAALPSGGVQEIEDLRETLHDMAQRLQNSQQALEDYLRAITKTQDEERARLGRELHDETVQTLIALDHKAQMVQRSLEQNPALAPQRVSELRRMAASAVDEVRRLSRALRPFYLEELGLLPALEMLARDTGAAFMVVGESRRLTAEQELALFRIAQEAMNNARRHAGAKEMSLQLEFMPETIALSVSDRGPGFFLPDDFRVFTQQGHFGLIGMHERAQLVGGTLRVQTAPGRGTTVVASVPLRAG